GKLSDRQPPDDGNAAGQGDQDGEHRGKDRPVDEEAREHAVFSPPGRWGRHSCLPWLSWQTGMSAPPTASLGRLHLADVDHESPTALAVAADTRLALDQDIFPVQFLHGAGQVLLLFRAEVAEVQLPGVAAIGEEGPTQLSG